MAALATGITSVIFGEAIKEVGKNAGKGTSELGVRLLNTVSEKFKAKKAEGLLPSQESEADENDRRMFEQMLQKYMSQDAEFTKTLKQLLEELQKCQVVHGDMTIGETVEAKGDVKFRKTEQESKTGYSGNMTVGGKVKSENNVSFDGIKQKR